MSEWGQVHKPNPPRLGVLLKPIVEDITDQIVNRRNDCRLIWRDHYRVFVKTRRTLRYGPIAEAPLKLRHKRFRTLLRQRLKREGWIWDGPDVFVCKK